MNPLFALGALAFWAGQKTNGPSKDTRQPAVIHAQSQRTSNLVHIEGDVQTVPFTIIGVFPFIEAEINGVKGKLMFDTGTQINIVLNDNRVPLKDGKVVGKGFVGSGQTFVVKQYPKVERVSLAGKLEFADVANIQGEDTSFLYTITPDALGFIGYEFFDGYLLKLDYEKRLLIFYKATEERRVSQDFLKGETILAIVPFETRKLPNHPFLAVTIEGKKYLASIDTGQIGGLQLSAETKKSLTGKNLLKERGKERFELSGIEFADHLKTSVANVEVLQESAGVRSALGVTESDYITLGYAFLKQYKTVWDYPGKKLYVLKK